MTSRFSILGAGSWGTVLANLLACNGNECLLYTRNQKVFDSIIEDPTNLENLFNYANLSILVGISVVEQYLAILLAISILLLPAMSFIEHLPGVIFYCSITIILHYVNYIFNINAMISRTSLGLA